MKPYYEDKKSVTAWLPNDLLARLDAHLAQLAASTGHSCLKPSRQTWIAEAIRESLDIAQHSAALAEHRARLAGELVLAAAEATTAPELSAVEAMRSAEAADREAAY